MGVTRRYRLSKEESRVVAGCRLWSCRSNDGHVVDDGQASYSAGRSRKSLN